MSQPRGPQGSDQPKPLPELAFRLAIEHQDEQQSIADKAAAGLALLWPLLQFDKLDATTPGWLHATTLQIEKQFRESEEAAFRYVQGAKWAVEPFSDPLKKVETRFPIKDVQLAMRATGPAAIKRATQTAFTVPESDSGRLLAVDEGDVPPRGLEELADRLLAWGKLNSTGAGVKHALNGGRGEVQQLVVVDATERIKNRQAIGWARFTEDSRTGPCYFCALLASQGAVFYSADSFERSNNKIRDYTPKTSEPALNDLLSKLDARADRLGLAEVKSRRAFIGDGPAKVHDHCKCSMRPVYREEDSMDARANFFLKQWKETPGGLKEFRRAYVRPEPYDKEPAVNLADVRRNRELVAQELGAGSPHVKWWDRQIRALSS